MQLSLISKLFESRGVMDLEGEEVELVLCTPGMLPRCATACSSSCRRTTIRRGLAAMRMSRGRPLRLLQEAGYRTVQEREVARSHQFHQDRE